MKQKYKRGRLLVNPAFQFALLARTGFYLVLYSLCVVHITFVCDVVMHMLNVPSGGLGKGVVDLYLDFIVRQRPLLLTLLLVSPLLLYDLLKFSNRIAGPLYRCRNVMQDMVDGVPVAEFRPRKHDLMHDFFETFDMLIKKLNSQVDARMNNDHADTTGLTSEAKVFAAPISPTAELHNREEHVAP